MSVETMKQNMSSIELQEWRVFYEVEAEMLEQERA